MTTKNEWADTIDAQREALKARDELIQNVMEENVRLKVTLGKYRAVIKLVDDIIHQVTGHHIE